MQSHSRPKVEIESLQSQQRPDADVYYTDSDNRAMAHGLGLDPRSHPVLDHGSQQQRGQAHHQRRGDRYEPPPSPAGSKRKHRRKDATIGPRAGCWAASRRRVPRVSDKISPGFSAFGVSIGVGRSTPKKFPNEGNSLPPKLDASLRTIHTQLVTAWSAGDRHALHEPTPKVYVELRRLADRYMRKERAGNTLQASALVNEVFMRLVDVEKVSWQDRARFFAVSANMMRRILVDRARAKKMAKRGAGAVHINLDEAPDVASAAGDVFAVPRLMNLLQPLRC